MGKLELFDDGQDGHNLPEQLKVNQSFADRFEVCFFRHRSFSQIKFTFSAIN